MNKKLIIKNDDGKSDNTTTNKMKIANAIKISQLQHKTIYKYTLNGLTDTQESLETDVQILKQ